VQDSIITRLHRLVDERPGAPALTIADAQVSRAELLNAVRRVAGRFTEAGVHAGSTVAIALPNSIEFLQSTIACWWLGATPQPVSHRLVSAELRAIVELADPDLVVGIDTVDAPGRSVLGDADIRTAAVSARPIPASSVVSNPWKIMASGGSTGRPKLIVDTRPALASTLDGSAKLLRMRPDGCVLVTGPLAHNAPFGTAVRGLLLGKHVILMRRFDAIEALDLIERHRVDWVYLVPATMHRIWQLPEAERLSRDLSSVDIVYHMAAPCPAWLKRAWIDWLGPEKILELYGGSEGQAITMVDGTEWLARPGTVGRPASGEMQVRDDDGNPVAPGVTGEIWMRPGPDAQVRYRYIGAEARRAAGNWESLGDMGRIDADGYVYITDRRTDMIVVGGTNVYPAEIEAALNEHPQVRSSCVIGLPHPELGNAPHALVELAAEVDDRTLFDHLQERVAVYKLPKSFERVDHPLRDEAGKVRRSAFRAERLVGLS
jgi:bile acid-coenzyme A ligase